MESFQRGSSRWQTAAIMKNKKKHENDNFQDSLNELGTTCQNDPQEKKMILKKSYFSFSQIDHPK